MSRITVNINNIKTANLEMALVNFGANFLNLKNIFRRDLSKVGFVAFKLFNISVSD